MCIVDLDFEHVTEVVSAVGRRGLTSEKVAKLVASEAQSYIDIGAPVGPHLADQLLMPLALSACAAADAPVRRGGSFRTGPLTPHTTTHIDILSRFLPAATTVESNDDGTFIIKVAPLGG